MKSLMSKTRLEGQANATQVEPVVHGKKSKFHSGYTQNSIKHVKQGAQCYTHTHTHTHTTQYLQSGRPVWLYTEFNKAC